MSTTYEAIIGLEFHIQIISETKMFCNCRASFGDPPNVNTCPVCLGLPGSLPVINKAVVDQAIKIAVALGCTIQPFSQFARKNYFYPDLPKGYQISQFEYPFATDGFLELQVGDEVKRIGLIRAHLEEDAGKLVHSDVPWVKGSFVDMNRCGVPLMEVVTKPELRHPAEARAFMHKLRNLLRHIGVCEGNLEQGNMRCDANLSVRPVGSHELRTPTELKNLNSFKFVQQALEYEFERQVSVYEAGGPVIRETRQYDAATGKTFSQRTKESAEDYRYFPEPDLVKLVVDNNWIQNVKKTLPELPDEMRDRFVKQYNIPEYDARVLTTTIEYGRYFEAAAQHHNPKLISNWIMSDLSYLLKQTDISIQDCKVPPESLAELVGFIESGKISTKIAKEILEEIFKSGDKPAAVIERRGLTQISDETVLTQLVDEVLAQFPGQVQQYKSGKAGLFGFFVGNVMKRSQGKANPGLVNDILKQKLQS